MLNSIENLINGFFGPNSKDGLVEESSPKVPESSPKVPESSPEVTEIRLKVPKSISEIPEIISEIPEHILNSPGFSLDAHEHFLSIARELLFVESMEDVLYDQYCKDVGIENN
ncbi:hypothetical protein TI04_10680 [Achromatium sp. WMS2]|nr:hypothetical protein TI04_10680 [Achromatium sp. WMS2]